MDAMFSRNGAVNSNSSKNRSDVKTNRSIERDYGLDLDEPNSMTAEVSAPINYMMLRAMGMPNTVFN